MNRTRKVVTVVAAMVVSLIAEMPQAGVLSDIGAEAYQAAGSPSFTAVIPPGYSFVIDGKKTPVIGQDLCPHDPLPPSKYLWVMGGHPVAGRGCVVVGPETKVVSVALLRAGGARTVEKWTVDRQQRNGVPVLALQRTMR